MTYEFEGYHGTSFDNAISITGGVFKNSVGDEEWLGDGVYFFVDGMSKSPGQQAEDWAIANAWDNMNKKNKYTNYSILKADINVTEDNFLDLTNSDGTEILDYILAHHERKILKLGKKLDYIDGLIINFARGEGILNIDVVKGHFYIKFTRERINRINRRTSNCTICAAYNPDSIKNLRIIANKNIL